MILRNARFALNARDSRNVDSAVIERGRIHFSHTTRGQSEIDLSGFLLLPGLINAHDHLEFNLFPRLGTSVYANASGWANDIYQPDQDLIRRHRSLDKRARLIWGALKNSLSGVTTVAHHNPYEQVFDDAFPLRVVRRYGWAHSLDFGPQVVERFRATPPEWPFIIHAAEGTDERARCEIKLLDDMGVLTERTVLVHAIAAKRDEWRLIAERRASVVWCPTSNLSLFDATLPPEAHTSGVLISLGTDSAISAPTTLAAEVLTAQRLGGLDSEDLFSMVTSNAARMLRLRDGEGELREGGLADFVVVRDHGQSPVEALLNLCPEAVAVGGEFRMMSETFFPKLPLTGFHPLEVAGQGVCWVDVDMPSLHDQTTKVLGPEICLAGRRISA
jgi:cytosine/adenosine deaminase-related metal-dependent hydrolase